jgi:hypothetical protein
MRIKLFETFENNDYYQEIESDEWFDSMNSRIEISHVLNNIKNLFGDKFICKERFHSGKTESIIEVTSWGPNTQSDYQYLIRITLNDDEWFYVHCVIVKGLGKKERTKQSIKIYKCDQWEGLVKLLKDKSIL